MLTIIERELCRSFAVLFALALIAAGCGGDDGPADSGTDNGTAGETSGPATGPSGESRDTGTTEVPTGTVGMATIRFVNLLVESDEDVDVRREGDGLVLFEELAPLEASLPTDVPAGEFSLEFAIHVPPGGGSSTEGEAVASSGSWTFVEGQAYSVTIYPGADGPAVVVFEDDVSPIADGLTRLRGVHAAPGIGSASVSLTSIRRNEESRFEVDGDEIPFVDGLLYGGVSEAQEFEGNSWYLIGVDVGSNGDVDALFRTPSPLTPGFNTTAYILELDGEPAIYAHVISLNAVLPVPVVGPDEIDEPAE